MDIAGPGGEIGWQELKRILDHSMRDGEFRIRILSFSLYYHLLILPVIIYILNRNRNDKYKLHIWKIVLFSVFVCKICTVA